MLQDFFRDSVAIFYCFLLSEPHYVNAKVVYILATQQVYGCFLEAMIHQWKKLLWPFVCRKILLQ